MNNYSFVYIIVMIVSNAIMIVSNAIMQFPNAYFLFINAIVWKYTHVFLLIYHLCSIQRRVMLKV